MPAAIAFAPVALGALTTAGGLAAFAATTAGMFTIAGAALGAVGAITGDKGLATIGTLVSLGSSVVGMTGGAGAAAEAGMTAADTVNGAINTDGLQAANAILDPTAQTLANSGGASGAVETSDLGEGLADAAKNGQSIAGSVAQSPAEALNSQVSPGTGGMNAGAPGPKSLIGNVMNWANKNQTLASGLMNVGGKFIEKGFGRNVQAEQVDLNRERLALEQRLAEIQLSNKNSAAGVNVGVSANTSANLFPNGPYRSPGGGFIDRARQIA